MPSLFKTPNNEVAQALGNFKGAFRSVGIFSAIINLMLLVPSLYMLQVYDRVLASRNETTLWMLTVMVVGAYLFMSALEFVRSIVLIRVGAQLDMKLNRRIYTAAFEQNLRKAGGNAGQALQDLTTVRQFVTGNGLFAFFDAPWFPVYLVVIFLFNPMLGLFALCGTAALIALAFVNEAVSRKPLSDANTLAISANNAATNNLRNAEVIEAMGMLPNMMTRWFKLHGRFLQLQAEASGKAGIVGAGTKFFRTSLQSLILALGALLVLDGKITAGMMVVSSILMGRTLNPVEQLIGVWKSWASTRTAYARLVELLDANPPRKTGMSLPRPKGFVALQAVSAAPPGLPIAVIRNLSFSIAPGDVLGVIGPSGSGKSTLARLLVGVWPASVGKVRLDGADLYQWNKDELGPSIGYLPQDIELFAGTVSENIARFGELDPDKVVAAAKLTGVHEMILQLRQGYDTPLGDGGTGLSGGQKQRIALARALYDDPSLLVLDEPNSNLDEVGEQALAAAIAAFHERGKTVVLVSHRASALAVTNKLLLLHDGAAQMFGPTAQVLAELTRLAAQGTRSGLAPGAPPATAHGTLRPVSAH
ncbi:MAG: type I secretion system permease/ATPase [Polaromonas sp. 39-63-203]|jgi:ATP-binding cassette subfamily C exporter for protease/lipase|uniref:type I secretion system permease/ATPase n=1 Tax=Polaromonas sp. TaxID=1869339 RepID=UPI000BC66FAB|nr:type I secretion system permease/ATPase [Polaromonas sp.]OYY52122.1 MAG: type I secretion system permease/ATPase [Polaromonas sp. 35-63-240]OYY96856.1 MAG: type I secretion system permease/ATPase [Polaromonas sp. 28-63-22]OYZ83639.1 MAG: type I secretion system permease/ATPase [Polaromonas sp. 24-62-144]OZA97582.1 MAG: type I secretion system permease/ATPase [Polaromonas sp. 39-63-203]HQS31521.1 type I secretion system permease/ATPase [Polaromonas sp.]